MVFETIIALIAAVLQPGANLSYIPVWNTPEFSGPSTVKASGEQESLVEYVQTITDSDTASYPGYYLSDGKFVPPYEEQFYDTDNAGTWNVRPDLNYQPLGEIETEDRNVNGGTATTTYRVWIRVRSNPNSGLSKLSFTGVDTVTGSPTCDPTVVNTRSINVTP